MRSDLTLRVARPTHRLPELAAMYTAGLGLDVLASFVDHDGFDGVILGHSAQPYHLEFTSRRGEQPSHPPTAEHLLVFYVPDHDEWETACGRMHAAGFREVSSSNPYWDVAGKTFEDIDRYRVVLQNAAWEDEPHSGRDPVAYRPLVLAGESETSPVAPAKVISIQDEAQCEALGAFLVDRIYEFNSKVTGYFDGQLLAGCVRSDAGAVIAGYNGHSWGGCCELSNVWVHESHRGRGLGALLLRSAEAEARARGCVQVVLATHNFQAPGFYERMGYERTYTIEGRPKNHSDIIYVKVLGPTANPVDVTVVLGRQ